MLQIYNTLSRKKEEFKPIKDNEVGMYTCGPTVYNVAHIGNLRTYVFEDILKRVLKYDGYQVKHVMNITDVDDKTIRAGQGKKAEFSKLTKLYEEKFLADLKSLNVESPDKLTRATEYIDQMVAFIQVLLDKGFAYRAGDGSIYFSIDKFSDYGKLSCLDKEGIQAGARVAQDEYDKENPSDFALWKAWDEKDGEIFWETPLGKGRPGWHIECSVMSSAELGETIDIHAGAVDLVFPHHENEIAQSEAKSGQKFVNYWIHGEHLMVDGKKMAKSLNNMYILDDLSAKGFSPLDLRFLILGAHYRMKLNFTWESIEGAKIARLKLNEFVAGISSVGKINEEFKKRFIDLVNDDLAMPQVMALVWEVVKSDIPAEDKKATLLDFDQVLGLGLAEVQAEEIPENIKTLAEARWAARQNKDWSESDSLREELEAAGWQMEDGKDSYKLKKS